MQAVVNEQLSVAVRVTTAAGQPVANVAVQFTVVQGGGTAPATQTTDASGQAQVSWRVGTRVGENQLQAGVSGLPPVLFQASARAGPPAALLPVFGNGQSVPAGTAVPYVVIVGVVDAFGNAVPEVDVDFQALGGQGLAYPLVTRTRAPGLALANWRTGTVPGPNVLRVSASGVAQSLDVEAIGRQVVTPFQLVLSFENAGAFTAAEFESIQAASRKVRSILPAAPVAVNLNTPGFNCLGVPIPAFQQVVTNPIIRVAVRDFAGDPAFQQFVGLNAVATVCAYRVIQGQNNYRIVVIGLVVVNAGAPQQFEAVGGFEPLMTHEFLHALGLGTIWGPDPAHGWSDLVQGRGGPDPRFLGPAAIAAYGQLPGNPEGAVPVPLHNLAVGTSGHWRTSAFGTAFGPAEIMLAQQELGFTPLTTVSAASLADLGYEVSLTQADPLIRGLAAVSAAAPGFGVEALAAMRAELRGPGPHTVTDRAVMPDRVLIIEVESGVHRWREIR
jgi:hypothetical protein